MRSEQTSSKSNLITPYSIADRYAFVEEIGHGAQGRIFKAVRLSDGLDVVIKQLNVSSVKNWKEYELFKREGAVLKSLNMKGVAHFYDAIECLDEEPAYSYIVQELIPGVSLQQMLNDGHRFRVDDVYDLTIQALEILDNLHHHDPPVVHRDIKPSNLMISPDANGHYRITIIDFGAVANPQVQGGGSTVAGTFGYMPPEQLMGKPCPASDVYSIAAVAVQLFCGKSPALMPTKDFRLIFEPDMQDKPIELVNVLRKMLEPNVENRFADIPAIISQLKEIQNERLDRRKYKEIVKYEDGFEADLEAVRFIGQDGNFELWQSMPDTTPRKLPKSYEKLLTEYQIAKKNKRGHKGNPVGLLGALAIVAMLIRIGLLSNQGVSFREFIGDKLLVILLIVFVVLLILSKLIKKLQKKESVFYIEPSANSLGNVREIDTEKEIRNIIQKGRKGMGIISGIKYVPVDDKYVENGHTSEKEGYKETHYVQCPPLFVVQYKFNPPDDKREDDIMHEFITHIEPEGHYKEGDPLPILYSIKDFYFRDVVTSMPFPMPFDDIQSLNDMIDVSEGFERDRHIDRTSAKYHLRRIREALEGRQMTDMGKLIEETDFGEANQMFIPMFQRFLLEQQFRMIHRSCMKALINMAYNLNNKEASIPEAFVGVLEYYAQKPRTLTIPDTLVVEDTFAYFIARKRAWAGHFVLPDRFWDLILEIVQEKEVGHATIKCIIDGCIACAPDAFVVKLRKVVDVDGVFKSTAMDYAEGKDAHYLEVYEEFLEKSRESHNTSDKRLEETKYRVR